MNPKLRAGFAVTYANLGQFDKAREEAYKALELGANDPQFTSELKAFISTLPQ